MGICSVQKKIKGIILDRMAILQKLKNRIIIYPAISLLVTYPKELKAETQIFVHQCS